MPARTAIALLALGTGIAVADGRAPGTSTIHFERGAEQNVAVGMTFGLLLSHDNGSSWSWMCEAAVGYGGTYDPSYAYTRTGAIFATTFNGLAEMRDGCRFALVPQTTCASPAHCTFVSADATDGSGDFFYAAADPHDASLYRSRDDGSSFQAIASPGQNNDYWQSLVVAPSDARRVYLAGYRVANGVPKQFLLLSSHDGGASFAAMAGGSAVTTDHSVVVDVATVDPHDAGTLYLTVKDGDGPQHAAYALWRSTDAGATFTRILDSHDSPISALARRNRDLVAATQQGGVRVSHDRGASWSPPLPHAPHVNCLAENTAGELWACTQNYGGKDLPSDDAGIMKTTDLARWTTVLRYQDIVGPVSCDAGTTEQDTCVAKEWCTLAKQLQITATPVDCAGEPEPAPPSPPPQPAAATPSPTVTAPRSKPTDGGCCDGGGGASSLAAGAIVLALSRRRRASSGCRT